MELGWNLHAVMAVEYPLAHPGEPSARVARRILRLHCACVMLQNVSEAIRDCYRRASECREWAAKARHADTRQHYLRMEDRWLKLARSYEFTGRLTDFTAEMKRRIADDEATLPLPAIECPRCGGTMRLTRIEPVPAGATPQAESVTLECDCRYSLQQIVETS
jgi:hypothetical protein